MFHGDCIVGVSPPQPLEPSDLHRKSCWNWANYWWRVSSTRLWKNWWTCCLFVGWSDLWVGAVCENPFRWVFVRISWTQNGKNTSEYLELDDKFDVLSCFLGYFPILKATEDMEVLTACDSLGGNGGYLGGEKAPKILMSLDSETKNWWFVDVFPFPKWAFSGSSRSFGMSQLGVIEPQKSWKARNAFNSNVALWICKLPCRAPSTSGCKKKSRSERRKKFTYMMNQ